jgi:hypothetical protein
MSCLKLIVLGGDDVGWINKGAKELPYFVRQLDDFHLARSCKRWWKNGLDMYFAIRSGKVRRTLGKLEERTGKSVIKERDHVYKCLDRGIDWRNKVESIVIPDCCRGLGCMESNEDKLFADRMKKKGMSCELLTSVVYSSIIDIKEVLLWMLCKKIGIQLKNWQKN